MAATLKEVKNSITKKLNSLETQDYDLGIFYQDLKSPHRKYDRMNPFWAQSPESKEHVNILNPSFSFEPSSENALNLYPFWLLRDGAIPLIEFFYELNPIISKYRGTILVHENLKQLIPPGQKCEFLTYKLSNKDAMLESHKGKRDKVIISGIINYASFSKDHLRSSLQKIDKKLKSLKLSWKNVIFNLYLRENQFFNMDHKKVSPLFDYMKIINKYVGKNLNLINEKNLFTKRDYSDSYYFLLHEENILISPFNDSLTAEESTSNIVTTARGVDSDSMSQESITIGRLGEID